MPPNPELTPGTPTVNIGTAGWAIPRQDAASFPGEGPHLNRYARILPCAEINATFYRQPRASTLARWAQSVPPRFRFSVKAPKAITHTAALACTPTQLAEFLDAISGLGPSLGPILFQIPPSLAFEEPRAASFFSMLREQTTHPIALEPRHASWFSPAADTLLRDLRIARVAADPAKIPAAAHPGGWPGLLYFRLHGSPRTYYSSYSDEYLTDLAHTLHRPIRQSAYPGLSPTENPGSSTTAAPPAPEIWCIFDNTASGAAAGNALTLQRLLTPRRTCAPSGS